MSDLYEILYVNLHYNKKPWSGIGFIAFWCGLYLVLTGVGCAWMWFNR